METPDDPGGRPTGGAAGGGPRILATTAGLLLSPLDWVLDAIADAGFRGAELLISHDAATRDPDHVSRLAAAAGLDIPVVHGPYMLLLRRVLGMRYESKSQRALEIAGALGAQTMVAHAPFRWERRARSWLEEADERADEMGTCFAMENLYPVAGHGLSSAITPEQLAAFRNVVFDTSHFGVAGVDLVEAWDELSDRVCHLHVSDNLGRGRDDHAPLGNGVLPLESFLAHVGRSGFAGTVTLEVDCRPHLETRESLVAFLAGERAKVESLLAAGHPTTQDRPSVARAGADQEE